MISQYLLKSFRYPALGVVFLLFIYSIQVKAQSLEVLYRVENKSDYELLAKMTEKGIQGYINEYENYYQHYTHDWHNYRYASPVATIPIAGELYAQLVRDDSYKGNVVNIYVISLKSLNQDARKQLWYLKQLTPQTLDSVCLNRYQSDTISTCQFMYDDKGYLKKMVKTDLMDFRGPVTTIANLNYIHDKNIIINNSETVYDSNNHILYKYIYELIFDGQKRLIEYSYKNTIGNLTISYKWNYDEKSRVTHFSKYNTSLRKYILTETNVYNDKKNENEDDFLLKINDGKSYALEDLPLIQDELREKLKGSYFTRAYNLFTDPISSVTDTLHYYGCVYKNNTPLIEFSRQKVNHTTNAYWLSGPIRYYKVNDNNLYRYIFSIYGGSMKSFLLNMNGMKHEAYDTFKVGGYNIHQYRVVENQRVEYGNIENGKLLFKEEEYVKRLKNFFNGDNEAFYTSNKQYATLTVFKNDSFCAFIDLPEEKIYTFTKKMQNN